ncbi:hypothetical protein ES703_73690 [subsurface metagenome]
MCKSRIEVQPPIVRLPSYKKWGVPRSFLVEKLRDIGIQPVEFPGNRHLVLTDMCYGTDKDGWAVVLPNLVLKSSLYTKAFKCPEYAWRAALICADRYGLNSFRPVVDADVGNDPEKAHAYDIFPMMKPIYEGGKLVDLRIEAFCLFEPNEGYEYSGGALPMGEHGYRPEYVFV